MENFNSSSEFLLDLNWVNLCEQADRDGFIFRCKLCGATVRIHERKAHFKKHRGIRKRQETMRQARIQRERAARLAKAREAKQ